jgi:hypothetical protein
VVIPRGVHHEDEADAALDEAAASRQFGGELADILVVAVDAVHLAK